MVRRNEFSCPVNCADKHRDTEVNMAEIKKDLSYIKEKLDENTEQHQDIIKMIKELGEKKADKSELDKLNTKFWAAVTGTIGLLIAFLFWFLNNNGG